MNIDLQTLKKAFELIANYLEGIEKQSVELNKDFYWEISTHERYNPYQEPKDLTLGQLSDDLEHIQKIVSEEEDCTAHSLIYLVSLLKYFSENTVG